MKVEQKGHTVILKDTQGDLDSFRLNLTNEYKTFQKSNIIVDIRMYKTLSVAAIESFLPLSKAHRKTKKSFIIVTSEPDFNAVSDKLAVVRSLQEAHDIIEMEEIERDLGF
jgi:anti-anti-sigma regulatory factor